MPAYIVAYDLHEPGQKYECLSEKLEAYGTYWHMQQSVWIIVTDRTAVQIRDNLLTCLDQNDTIFVGRLSDDAAWSGTNEKTDKWIQSNLGY